MIRQIKPRGMAKCKASYAATLGVVRKILTQGALRVMQPKSSATDVFGTSVRQTTQSLLRLHSRLRGELVKESEGEATILSLAAATRGIGAIESLLGVLEVPVDPMTIRPIRTRKQIGPLGYGELRQGILAALRETRSWMTARQLADRLMEKNELKLDAPAGRHFLQKLREACHVLAAKGLIEKGYDQKRSNPNEQIWRLSPTMFPSR